MPPDGERHPLGEVRLTPAQLRLMRRVVWQGAATFEGRQAPAAEALLAEGLARRMDRRTLRRPVLLPTARGLRWWALYGKYGR